MTETSTASQTALPATLTTAARNLMAQIERLGGAVSKVQTYAGVVWVAFDNQRSGSRARFGQVQIGARSGRVLRLSVTQFDQDGRMTTSKAVSYLDAHKLAEFAMHVW